MSVEDLLKHVTRLRPLFEWQAATTIIQIVFDVIGIGFCIWPYTSWGPNMLRVGLLWFCVGVLIHPRWQFHTKLYGGLALLCVGMFMISDMDEAIEARELAEKEGVLTSAGLSSPSTKCPVPSGALAVYLGDNVAWTARFPQIVLEIESDKKGVLPYDLVSFDRDEHGALLVNATVFDDRSDLVAKIERNHLIATNQAAHLKRINKSSFEVFDHLDKSVLRVDYFNEHAIRLTGVFRAPYLPNDRAVVVNNAEVVA